MTAHGMAVACGVAVLAMGAIGPAAAFDNRQIASLDSTSRAHGEGDWDAADRFNFRTDRGANRSRGKQPKSAFRPYAGFGISKFKLAMDFDSGNVALKKDKRKGTSRPRLILGMGYAVTENISLGLEYRAQAADQPLFSLDVGSETLDFDTRFTRHNVFLRARYKF